MSEDLRETLPGSADQPETSRDDSSTLESGLHRPFSRRRLVVAGLGVVCAGYASAMAYPVYRYLMAPARKFAELAAETEKTLSGDQIPPVGAATVFALGVGKALLIHQPDGTFKCFSAVCTHLGCTVQFQPDRQRIYCNCHGGTYDMHTGKNVAGPPPKPLTEYHVEVADGKIVVSRA